MSFWTSVTFARPDPPPVVTAGDLLRLADAVAATGVVDDPCLHRVDIKFGRRVDQDRDDTVVREWIHENAYRLGQYPWDVDARTPEAVAAVRAELSVDRRQVCRVMLGFGFGTLARRISTALRTDRPDNGRANLVFGDVSIQVDVIAAGGLNDDAWQVG